MNSELLRFESEVMYNVMLGNVDIRVTNNCGETPVISCLDSEPVSVLLQRVERAGGAGTVFSLGGRGGVPVVRCVEVVDSQCALGVASDDVSDIPNFEHSTIGLLFDYVRTQRGGVRVPLFPSGSFAQNRDNDYTIELPVA